MAIAVYVYKCALFFLQQCVRTLRGWHLLRKKAACCSGSAPCGQQRCGRLFKQPINTSIHPFL